MEKKECFKLQGAKFVLLDEHGKELACGVTDKHGEILFDCLPFGKYFIKEVEAPCGFEKNDEICEITIGCERPHRCVEVINEKKKGSIRLVKLGCER